MDWIAAVDAEKYLDKLGLAGRIVNLESTSSYQRYGDNGFVAVPRTALNQKTVLNSDFPGALPHEPISRLIRHE